MMRTKLLANGATLARVVAGDGHYFHVRLEACNLDVSEEVHTAGAVGMGFGTAGWPVPDDMTVRVVLTFDFRAKTIATIVGAADQPLPAARTQPIRGDGAVSAIELGSAHGFVASAVGSIWLDDLTIE